MKVQIVKKEFNGFEIGHIVGFSEHESNNHLVNEGFIACTDIPENINPEFVKVEYDLVPAYWSKSGQSNVSVQPTIQVNQPLTQVDNSWEYSPEVSGQPQHWSKDGFAVQYDQPPMIIVEGEEVEDTSWTHHPESFDESEYWYKENEESVFSQPTIEVDNFVTVNDESWTHHPEQMTWIISEDTVKKAAHEEEVGINKYVKRIQYADRLIAGIAKRNETKTLTIPQTIEMNTVYTSVMTLLKSGSFNSAKSVIMAATPSAGITSADITYVVGLIDNYLQGEA